MTQDYAAIGAAVFAMAQDEAGKPIEWTKLPIEEKMDAGARWRAGDVRATEPVDESTLAIFAHECGHLALHHLGQQQPSIHQETEATKWGLRAIRKAGGNTTPAIQEQLRDALKTYVPTRISNEDKLSFFIATGRLAPKDHPTDGEKHFLAGGEW